MRRGTSQSQLTTHDAIFNFCKDKLQNEDRIFFYVNSNTIKEIVRSQEARFSLSKTIKGTRDFHSFHVISTTEFEARHYTLQEHGTILSFGESFLKNVPNINEFVAVKFGADFNIGVVTSSLENEITGQFYKKAQTGQTFVFSWPAHNVEHAFMSSDIICTVSEPVPTTRTQRAFKLLEED